MDTARAGQTSWKAALGNIRFSTSLLKSRKGKFPRVICSFDICEGRHEVHLFTIIDLSDRFSFLRCSDAVRKSRLSFGRRSFEIHIRCPTAFCTEVRMHAVHTDSFLTLKCSDCYYSDSHHDMRTSHGSRKQTSSQCEGVMKQSQIAL